MALLDLLLAREQQLKDVTQAFRDIGAVSPVSARPLAELPELDPKILAELLERGTVREAAPGAFYVFAGQAKRRPLVLTLLFWLLLLAVPIAVIQFHWGW